MVQVQLGGQNISQVSQAVHLGVERNENNTPDTQKRIETARKTMYALLGSGMHGKNGISPVITIQMWNTFVLPRLLHGIELLDIRKKDLTDLELYQRKVLKQLQNLPERTASVAVLALVGAKTIEAQIDIKILTTFINIAMDPSTIKHQIALRQLLVKQMKALAGLLRSSTYYINMTFQNLSTFCRISGVTVPNNTGKG